MDTIIKWCYIIILIFTDIYIVLLMPVSLIYYMVKVFGMSEIFISIIATKTDQNKDFFHIKVNIYLYDDISNPTNTCNFSRTLLKKWSETFMYFL